MLQLGHASAKVSGFAQQAKEDKVLSQVKDAVRGEAAESAGTAVSGKANILTSEALVGVILTSLNDIKAEEVVKIDLRGKSQISDWMVIASGNSSRQVTAISEHLVDRLKQDHGRLSRIEGKDAGDWVLIDLGDAIVHVFRPEVREFYQLEKLWLAPGQAAASGA